MTLKTVFFLLFYATVHCSKATLTKTDIDAMSDKQVSKTISKLRKIDPEFYRAVKPMKAGDRRLYLKLNQRRLSALKVAGVGAAGLAAGAILGRMAQNKELKALETRMLELKPQLYMSRIARRKEFQELQFSIYQLKNAASALGDHAFSKSYELENQITSRLGY